MVLSFLLIVFIGRVQSTWESILTPDGWDDVFIPSTVHIELTTCLGNLHELMLVNKQLNTRIERLEATILQMQNTSHPPRPLIASPTSHTTSDTVHPITQPTKKQQTSQPTKQPTMRPTKPPTAQPTKQPTHAPTNKPTKFPTFKPTKRPIIPKPTQSPTHHPTIKPTDAWDRPAHVVTLPKAGKNGRQKPPKNSEEQGFDALIESANTNREFEQKSIIIYDCADAKMMHQLERDLIAKNELIVVRDWDYHGLPKEKSKITSHKFPKVKEYYTDPYYLAQHLLSFEDCFLPSETALNGTVTRYTYNVHHIKQWIGTVIQFIAVSTNKTRQLFNVIDDLVTVRHRVTHHNANSSLVHVLLVFMREIFRTAPDLLKQRQHKHRNQRMNKPMMEPPDVNPRIFHSARVMRAVLDFYAISCLSVIEMICKQVTDSFTSWATHSFVVNVTSWRHDMEQYRLDLSKRLHHTVGLLDRWLELSIDDEIVQGPSSDVMDELLEFGPLVQGWSDYGNTVEIAKMIYDWKRIKQLNAMNIHIPRVAMNDMEFEFMYDVLQELRYTIRADDLKIKRFNVTYLKKSPGPNKGKTRNKSPDQTMKLFNKYTLSEMPIRLGNITIQNENQGNVGVNTITTYESEDESVLEQLEQDLSRKCLNELVIITQWELEIDNATSQLHIGPDTFTRVKQCHDATDFAFYKFIEVWSVHFLLLIKTPVIAPQHLHPKKK
eukprot:127001_1